MMTIIIIIIINSVSIVVNLLLRCCEAFKLTNKTARTHWNKNWKKEI